MLEHQGVVTGQSRRRTPGRRLSVGLYTYSTRPRGSVVCAAALAEALVRRGHDVVLYALDKGEGGFYRSLHCPLRLMEAAPATQGSDGLIAQRIEEVRSFVLGEQPNHDVHHAQDCLVASGLLKARSSGTPLRVLRTVHHVDRFESPYLDACQRRSIIESDGVVSVSRSTQHAIFDEFGVQSTLIHNGIDMHRFVRPATPLTDLAWESRSLGKRPFVLSVGGVEPRKNSLRQLDAFLRVHAKYPELKWVIAGGASIWHQDDYASEFWSRVRRAAATQAIVRTGVLSDAALTWLYQNAAAYLHAATHEGWGLSVLEALCARTPVVVSEGAPFDEYLDAECAELVDPQCSSSIASGLERALRTTEAKLDSGRERAQRFDWSRAARAHETIYRQLVGCRDQSLKTP